MSISASRLSLPSSASPPSPPPPHQNKQSLDKDPKLDYTSDKNEEGAKEEEEDDDIFAPLLTLPTTFYNEGHALGFADGRAHARSESRAFGIEQGFRRGVEMGRLSAWVAVVRLRVAGRVGGMVEGRDEGTVEGKEPRQSSLHGDRDRMKGQRHDRDKRTESTAGNTHDACPSAYEEATPTTQIQEQNSFTSPRSMTVSYEQSPERRRQNTPQPRAAPQANPTQHQQRLQKHLSTLSDLTDLRTLDLGNDDKAVGDFDERMRRAKAKVVVVERLVGGGGAGDRRGQRTGEGDELAVEGKIGKVEDEVALMGRKGRENIEDFGK